MLICAQRGTSKDGSLGSNSKHCPSKCQPIEESLNKLQYTVSVWVKSRNRTYTRYFLPQHSVMKKLRHTKIVK